MSVRCRRRGSGARSIPDPRDIVGTAEEILETPVSDPILPEVSEVRLELPYEFADEEYRQIIQDFTTLIAPQLGSRRDAATSA